jgi:Predicted membrane protein (DUF2207)
MVAAADVASTLVRHAPWVAAFLVGWAILRALSPYGKDRAFVGLPLAASRNEPGTATRKRINARSDRSGPVEFGPPEGLPPALLAAVVNHDGITDGNNEVFSATIVDLATRGHLKLEQVTDGKTWKLTRTEPQRRIKNRASMLSFESQLLRALFPNKKQTVVLSNTTSQSFGKQYVRFLECIDEEVKKKAWYVEGKLKTMAQLSVLGFALIFLAPFWLFVLNVGSKTGVGSPIACSVALGCIAIRRGYRGSKFYRTSSGSAMYARVLGFKKFLQAGELRMEHAEQAQLFIDFLPYAIALGVVDTWTERFSHLPEQLRHSIDPQVNFGVTMIGRRTMEFAQQLVSELHEP